MDEIVVGPSKQGEAWRKFFAARGWNPADLARLVEGDHPGAAFFEIETQINAFYAGALKHQGPGAVDPGDQARFKARWVDACTARLREALGPRQRDLDLGLMRWMRRSSCLSVVIGAGATMDAGGPSWPELVRRLLEQQAGGGARAREILELIAAGRADTEVLMEGAQLCHDARGQHLFADLSDVLYEQQRRPGPIHRAIAELGAPVDVNDSYRQGRHPGWDSIITYNFDDLMGEALDAAGLPRAAYAMRGDEVMADPNPRAFRAGPEDLHQRIYHLHGYTPRRPFLITDVRFVFSTSQYEKIYGKCRAAIIDHVFSGWLARPIHHALYVGCSFQDEAMNALLRDAAGLLPGRYHYALLKWPGEAPFVKSAAEDIAVRSARYAALGVRPIWFDDFREIPELIRRLT